jgi:hypothetical protein
VARLDDGHFVTDVAVESDVTNGRFFIGRQLEARVESVLLAVVTQDERLAFVRCREYDDKGADHVHAAGCILKESFPIPI